MWIIHTLLSTISIILMLFYLLLMLSYLLGWLSLPKWRVENSPSKSSISSSISSNTSVSVIVPARNESSNIVECLDSILKQDYPKTLFEIIVVDDHSEDNTSALILKVKKENFPFPIRLLALEKIISTKSAKNAQNSELDSNHFNQNSFKKMALTEAIRTSKADLIVTTDADCLVPSTWLSTIVDCYEEKQAKFITGPVIFHQEKTWLQKIWSLDFVGMMGLTGASVHWKLSNMSNGANLAYERSLFWEVNAFDGIDGIASGDDLLLMEKISQVYPNDLYFLKSLEATVKTPPPEDLRAFYQQRVRWASKSTYYKDWKIRMALAAVWLFNLNLLLLAIFSVMGFKSIQVLFMGQILLKIFVDALFLSTCCLFFQRKKLLWLFLPAQIFHVLYIVIIGLLGNVTQYEWKGRRVE